MTTPPRCWPWDFLCLGAAHLYRDVYKRQMRDSGFTVRRVEGTELLELLALCFEQDATHEAVSYTHLDVYKRQVRMCVEH